MANSAELVVMVSKLARALQEETAQGFNTPTAMNTMFELKDVIDRLESVATKEFMQ